MDKVILFDGFCNLCNSSVQFILKRDKKGVYRFASLQGEIGQELLGKWGIEPEINSFVLIEENRVYVRSTAALRVCFHLKGAWIALAIFLLIPAKFRDILYNFIANHRYKWFGKQESCLLPQSEWRERFLE